MSDVFPYTFFHNSGRIGNDNCCVDQNTIQNVQSCNYNLENYLANDCSMRKTIDLATMQTGINYKGGYNVCSGGANIDDSSNLLIGTINTHPKCKIDLFHRPFATVPYLGRGSVCPIMESQIQQGEIMTNKRSVNLLSESCFIKYHNTPLLSEVKDRVTNPNYCVEGVASEGWIRGGIPSRELTKDTNYFTTHTDTQYV